MRRVLLACLVLAACADAAHELSPPRREGRDSGGSLVLRMLEIRDLEDRKAEKRISGICDSACTLYLGLSTTCFEPGATLGFHGPRLAFGLPISEAQFESLSHAMADYYPPSVRRRFLEEWRYMDDVVRIPAKELIARGEARACA